MTVLLVQDNLIQGFIARRAAQFFTHFLAVEHAGDLTKQFQVRIGSGFRDQQNEQQVNRCAVDGIEIDRGVKVHQGTDG
ncbi:hypothetical protein D3C87_1950580 [compost metagenome]